MNPKSQTAAPFAEHVLAAIVFTDVVEYSARMGRDEGGALHAVEVDFKRIRQLCARYGGTVHNTMGDGMLLSFTSAAHAVICALRLQQEFAARFRANPEALRHRMGIHLGDITLGEEGVAGDGVNIAARIMPLAAPGELCISASVYDAVKSHVRLKVDSLGECALKNITQRVPVCRVDVEASPLPMRTRIALRGKRPWGWLAGAAVGLLSLGLAWSVWSHRRPAAVRAPAPPAVATLSPHAIAVLPFADLSSSHDQEYLGDGLAEELINTLMRLPNLRVAARTSCFAFKGRNVPAGEIGRQLGVGTLIEGSVRKAEARVRISVRMTNTTDGFQLWSATFDRELSDVFVLQVELARTIAQKLQVTLDGSARGSLERLTTDNVEAYNYYLRARHLWNRRGPEMLAALKLFQQAIEADPYYALAYSGVADCQTLLAFYGYVPATQAMPPAFAAANRARELDPLLPDAYSSLGFIRMFHDWDGPEALEMFRQALERNPQHVGALTWRAATLVNLGRAEPALADAARATELDPLSPSTNLIHGWIYLLARRPAEAKPWLEKARDLNPNFSLAYWLLGQQADALGDYAGAAAHYEAGLTRAKDNPYLLAYLARARGLQGRSDDARAIIRQLEERRQREYVRAYLFAIAHTGRGETDAALAELTRALEERDLWVASMRNVTTLDALRSDPRYQAIEAAVGGKLWPAPGR